MSLEESGSITTTSTSRVRDVRSLEKTRGVQVRGKEMEMEVDMDMPFILQGPGVEEKEVGVAF